MEFGPLEKLFALAAVLGLIASWQIANWAESARQRLVQMFEDRK
jgi:hypothetical protein